MFVHIKGNKSSKPHKTWWRSWRPCAQGSFLREEHQAPLLLAWDILTLP